MPRPAKRDEKLTFLTETRDHVKCRMSAAWDNPSPDMPALEALHYELKNLEYRIATHEPDGHPSSALRCGSAAMHRRSCFSTRERGQR